MTEEQRMYYEKNQYASLLHTPDGVRDIYNGECRRKLRVQEQIHKVLKLYGFQDIQTPTFEFFDIFNKERGTIASREMYKFFDRDGNTLVLRPDMTPSIARCAAKYFKEETMPLRLCYMGNTFINNSIHKGKLNEMTQIGAELINDDTVDADAEMIVMTIQSLLDAGLKEFQVEVGHAGFLNGLMEECAFSWEEMIELKTLMESKNLFGVEEMVSSKKMNKDLKELILNLPQLFGNIENIHYAKGKVKNEKALQALERLEQLYDIIEKYEVSEYVTFDLGMLSRYDYYSGIILNAYTYGNGEAIVQGGRYDHLIGQFGKNAPAIGVAFVIDQLLLALSRQKQLEDEEENAVLVVYEESQREQAIALAKILRKEGRATELLCKKIGVSLEEYKAYGHRIGLQRIFSLQGKEELSEIFLKDGMEITTSVSKLSRKGDEILCDI